MDTIQVECKETATFARLGNEPLIKDTKYLINDCLRKGNSEFCFPETLNRGLSWEVLKKSV